MCDVRNFFTNTHMILLIASLLSEMTGDTRAVMMCSMHNAYVRTCVTVTSSASTDLPPSSEVLPRPAARGAAAFGLIHAPTCMHLHRRHLRFVLRLQMPHPFVLFELLRLRLPRLLFHLLLQLRLEAQLLRARRRVKLPVLDLRVSCPVGRLSKYSNWEIRVSRCDLK